MSYLKKFQNYTKALEKRKAHPNHNFSIYKKVKEIVSECAYMMILAKTKHEKKTWKKKKQLLDFFWR